jgi:hypothetical protein
MSKNSELPERFKRAFSEDSEADADAVARMQVRLEASLGTAFDVEVERPSGLHRAAQLRRLRWLGASTFVAVGVVLWSLRPSASVTQLPAAAPPPAALAAASSPAALAAAASEPAEEQLVARQPSLQLPQDPRAPDEVEAAPSLLAPSVPSALRAPSAQPPQPLDEVEAALSPAQKLPSARRASSVQPSPHKPRPAPPAANGGKPAPSSPSAAAEPGGGLAEELSGLDQIRALMGSSPQRALAATQQQQQQFSRGALGHERALLQLDALLRLGRTVEAEQLGQQLLAAQGNQPYRARIRKLLDRTP